MELSKDYLGKGIIFPFQLEQGKLPVVSSVELIKCNVKSLLAFELGQRFMQGEVGARLKTLTSEPANSAVIKTIGFFILEVIEVYEPRVKFISEQTKVSVNQSTGKVSAELFFIEKRSRTEFSFVLPFYKTPKLT
jgi:phage baseplate assembly protein W